MKKSLVLLFLLLPVYVLANGKGKYGMQKILYA